MTRRCRSLRTIQRSSIIFVLEKPVIKAYILILLCRIEIDPFAGQKLLTSWQFIVYISIELGIHGILILISVYLLLDLFEYQYI